MTSGSDLREPGTTQPNQVLLIVALLISIALAALDTSIVSTTLPKIVGSLGGLELFSWVFSVYLVTSVVTVPIYGKLADLYGRKPMILFGSSLFLVGSVLCGLAQSMEMLIAFRALQGLGAGAVLPITQTIIGDTFSIEQRAKIQGFFSGVWGVTAVAGPLIGGLITDNISWRWVFLVNLPIGLMAIAMISLLYKETTEKRRHSLDFLGAALLSGAVAAFLLVLLKAGESYGWLSWQTEGLTGVSILLLVLFVFQEQRAVEPLVPLSLFTNRVIIVSSLAIFLSGGLSVGVSSYVPLFEQGVFGGSATKAGLILAPMSITWIPGSMISGWTIIRYGYFPSSLIGGAFLFAGALILLGLTADTSIMVAAVAGMVMGVGMGFVTNSTVIAVQNAVDWGQRGIATASTQFFRSIGASICVATMGALLNSRMSDRLTGIAGAPEGLQADELLSPARRDALPIEVLQAMERSLASSLHETFLIVFAASAICLAVVAFFPRGRLSQVAVVSPPPARGRALAEAADADAGSG